MGLGFMAELRQPARRWYCVTPDGCVLGLLAGEGLLWLFERTHGFGFHPHKGWTFVITAAIVVAALLLMFAWFVVSLFVGRRFQFSIRSLLVLVVVVAIPCSWFAVEMKEARKQQKAVEEIRKSHGLVQYDWEAGVPKPPAPVWLLHPLGDDFFSDVAWVFASDTQFTDAALKDLKDWTELQELDLPNTRITDAGLKNLEGLTKLQRLLLPFTKVTDAGLRHLKGLTRLDTLLLSHTQVTDAGLVHLESLTQLETLDLDHTQVADAGLQHLRCLTRLKSLSLSNTRVTDAGLVHLKSLTQLGCLWLGGTQVTDAGLEHLRGLSKLDSLELDGSQVTDVGVKHLRGLTKLRTLWLSSETTGAGLGCLKDLRQLHPTSRNFPGPTGA